MKTEQWMRDAARQILTYLTKPCTCTQCEVDATDIIASEFAKYECEHEFGMFDVCQKCGYYGGHQPGAVEAHDPATPATPNGALWLCYHALKQSEWRYVHNSEGPVKERHLCPYCANSKSSRHDKDCMVGNALKAMDEAVAEAAPTTPEWISVDERLPEMDGITYLVYRIEYRTNIRYIETYTAQGQAAWHNKIKGLQSGITHWRPLPNPPGAGQGSKQ